MDFKMADDRLRYNEYNTNRGIDNPAVTEDDGTNTRPDLVISVQPQILRDSSRAVLPVATVNWQTNPRGQLIPIHGLDFLIGVTSLLIKQTVELNELTSKIESENRYIVKIPNGEALYIASEVSTSTQRCLCGAGRAFTMHLHDNTRQEALQFRRRLAGASCCFPCRLQEMQVITPPGDYIGRVQQRWTWMVPFFLVRDVSDNVLFVVEGPASVKRSALIHTEFKREESDSSSRLWHLRHELARGANHLRYGTVLYPEIMSGDSLREIGRLVHGWDRELVSFTTTLHIPDTAVQPKHKALLLGAAFLLEYTYFERAKTSWLTCNCF